ncbi:MAG: nucleotide exchange factor GrpE [Promethearchaeota archaeon]
MTEENFNTASENSEDAIKGTSESNVINKSEKIEDNSNVKTEEKTEKVKQLEEKEHHELEYFSKEECLKDIKNLENQLTEIKEKAQKLQKENDQAKNKYMHLQAEFENAQKRWNKSREDLRTQYTASVLKSFLPLYDSFKKAIESEKETKNNILYGFYQQFMNIFKSYGVEPIKVNINDLFDYSLHEALTSVEREDLPENSITEIVQDGFKYGKEVIRYTKVIISKKPKPPEPEPKEELVETTEIEDKDIAKDEMEQEPEVKKNKKKKPKKQKKENNNEESA